MCGRYSLTKPPRVTEKLLSLECASKDNLPRFNISPNQVVPAIYMCSEGSIYNSQMRWGYIPSWAHGAGSYKPMINARSETIAEKPYFREAFRKRRALIPADGYYEWIRSGKQSLPYRIERKDKQVFAFAGIWEASINSIRDEFPTFSIITKQSDRNLNHIHHRMPVILHQKYFKSWLNYREDLNVIKNYFSLANASEFVNYTVGEWVNNINNDDINCIRPLDRNTDKLEETSEKEELKLL